MHSIHLISRDKAVFSLRPKMDNSDRLVVTDIADEPKLIIAQQPLWRESECVLLGVKKVSVRPWHGFKPQIRHIDAFMMLNYLFKGTPRHDTPLAFCSVLFPGVGDLVTIQIFIRIQFRGVRCQKK